MIATWRFANALDSLACQLRLLPIATWTDRPSDRIYAGQLSRGLKQFHTHVGLTIRRPNHRNIAHDIRRPMPLADNTIETYQAEDVFEHLSYGDIPPVLDDIHRVLKPGGLFRFSVPDYRCDVLRKRSLTNDSGEILFDPGGGDGSKTAPLLTAVISGFPSMRPRKRCSNRRLSLVSTSCTTQRLVANRC